MWALLSAMIVPSQGSEICRTLTGADLGNQEFLSQGGLVAEFLAGDQRGSVDVRVLAYTVLCEATRGQKLATADHEGQRGGVIRASVVVRYQCQGIQCPEEGGSEMTLREHVQLFLAECTVLESVSSPQYSLRVTDTGDMECEGE